MTTRRLLLALGVLSVVSWTATLLTPLLAAWPLALAGLSPRLPFLLLASDSAPLPVFLAVGTARLMLADPIHHALGLRHGATRVPPRIQGWVGRFGLLAVAAKPNGLVMSAAGAGGLGLRAVLVADVVGTVAYLLVLRGGVSLLG